MVHPSSGPHSRDLRVRALQALLDTEVSRRESVRRPGLRWVETGTGPTVVLVAGAGEVCLDWVAVLPGLVADHRVVAVDRRGLGASSSAGPVTLRSQLDDLTGLLEEVGPAVLVGHSWGGLLTELVALERPDVLTGVVLVDPFRENTSRAVPWRMRVASEVMLAALVPMKAVGIFNRIATGMGGALADTCTSDPETRDLLAEAYVGSYGSLSQVAMIRRENRLSGSCDAAVRDIRARTTPPPHPMRILTASRGKPPDLQRRYAALAESTARDWPGGVHVPVPDAGHYIHHERPELVVQAVTEVG